MKIHHAWPLAGFDQQKPNHNLSEMEIPHSGNEVEMFCKHLANRKKLFWIVGATVRASSSSTKALISFGNNISQELFCNFAFQR